MGKSKHNNAPRKDSNIQKRVEMIRRDWKQLDTKWSAKTTPEDYEGYKWYKLGYLYGVVFGWYKTIDQDHSEDYRDLFPGDDEPSVPYSRQELFIRAQLTILHLLQYRYNEIPGEVDKLITEMHESVVALGPIGLAPNDDELDDDEMCFQATRIFWKGYIESRCLGAVPGWPLPPIIVSASRPL